MHDMRITWWGIDAGSGDHPMNTTIRYMRPDLTRRFEEKVGRASASSAPAGSSPSSTSAR
jgi:hypothetical protein